MWQLPITELQVSVKQRPDQWGLLSYRELRAQSELKFLIIRVNTNESSPSPEIRSTCFSEAFAH